MALADKLVLNVVDASAANVVNQVKGQELKGLLVPFYPVSNRIAALTDVVINAVAGQRGSIGVLRVCGHGTLEPHPGGVATMISDPLGVGACSTFAPGRVTSTP